MYVLYKYHYMYLYMYMGYMYMYMTVHAYYMYIMDPFRMLPRATCVTVSCHSTLATLTLDSGEWEGTLTPCALIALGR